jgi:hypothetical protein
MTLLADLIRKRKPKEVATAIPATSATQHGNKKGKIAKIATIAVASSQTHKPEGPTSDTQQKIRRLKVLTMLEENPDTQRAIYTDTHSDPDSVILTTAVRNVATCEIMIPKDKYDPWQLLSLTERLGVQNVH